MTPKNSIPVKTTVKIIRLILLFLLFFTHNQSFAQRMTITGLPSAGDNPVIYGLVPARNGTEAGTFYQVTGGHLRAPYEPPTAFRYGIGISSIRQIGKTGLSGQVSYVRHHRKNQKYSGLFCPASPLMSFSDTVPGTQKGETYHLSGTIAHPVTPHWKVELSIEYVGGNNAKDTDPRNLNTLNSINVNPGIGYTLGKIQIGIGFSYLRERETVGYQSFGTQTKNGVTFYPLWFHSEESFQYGINTERVYYRDTYGGSLRLLVQNKRWKISTQPEYGQGKEKIWITPSLRQAAGEIEHRSIRWDNHVEYLSVPFTHTFQPTFSFTRTIGYDEQQQLSSNNQLYETILKTKRFQISHTAIKMQYSFRPMNEKTTSPSPWETTIRFDYARRHTSFQIYPDNFIQSLSSIKLSAGYRQTFQLHKHALEYRILASYGKGYGRQPRMDERYENTKLHPNTSLMDMEHRYLTTPSLGASMRLEYSHPLSLPRSLSLFTAFQCDFHQGIKHASQEGGNYFTLLNVGCRF